MSGSALLSTELWSQFSDRLLFKNRLATGILTSIIMVWYLFQTTVLLLDWDPALVQWVFTTESLPELSPGLFLAVISHAFFPQLTHLSGNVALLWLFAGESEQHMGRGEVIGFFMGTGLAAVIGGTAISGTNTLGASGGALAFVGFYGIHLVFSHRDSLQLDIAEHGLFTQSSLRVYWHLAIVITPVALLLYTLGQLVGVLPAGRTDVFGHLIGISLGISYAIVRGSVTDSCRWSSEGSTPN